MSFRSLIRSRLAQPAAPSTAPPPPPEVDEAQLFDRIYSELRAQRKPPSDSPAATPMATPIVNRSAKPEAATAAATFATIPPFYQRLPPATDNLGQKLREEARTLFLQKRSRELLDNSELKAVWALLDAAHQALPAGLQPPPPPAPLPAAPAAQLPPPPPGSPGTAAQPELRPPPLNNAEKYISYDGFLRVRREAGAKCRRYLTSAIFARLQSVSGQPAGRVSILALFNYVMRKVWLQQTRIGLSLYDYTGQGYLREPNLEAYILELIPTLPQLEGLERSFHSFYVCTAVRKFFFFLDPLGLGRIRIRDILACQFLDDLLELRDDDAPKDAQEINWFSAPSALSVYGHYLNLDRDHNGMLSAAELAGYGSGTLTAVFLERVFAECHTYNGEMDYKTYLDFVLALENRSEPQSMHYLFRILDFEHCGYLTAFSLGYFFKGIEAQIVAHRAERVNFADVKDEIFDMVKPAHPERITLRDLLRSGQGETVISILIEFHKFWAYENREVIVVDTSNSGAAVQTGVDLALVAATASASANREAEEPVAKDGEVLLQAVVSTPAASD